MPRQEHLFGSCFWSQIKYCTLSLLCYCRWEELAGACFQVWVISLHTNETTSNAESTPHAWLFHCQTIHSVKICKEIVQKVWLSWPLIFIFWGDETSSSVMEETWAFLRPHKDKQVFKCPMNNLPAPCRMIECVLPFLFLPCKKSYLCEMALEKDLLLGVFWFLTVTPPTGVCHTIRGFPDPGL